VTGFLLDENLPDRLLLTPSLPLQHVRDLGQSLADTDIWAYAKEHNLVIVTKDADFSGRIISSEPPPKIVHLRFGNMRRKEFHAHLAKVWLRIEELLETNKLVNVYIDRLEATAQNLANDDFSTKD
jgi:predicted nuclease of predicted toxin-antitoxin system